MPVRPTRGNIRQLSEVAQMFRWGLQFHTPPGAVPVPDNFNLQCTGTALPKMEAGQSIEINIRGMTIKRPGTYNPSHQITLTFIETVDSAISEFLRAWREAVSNSETGAQLALSECTGDLTLTRLDNLDNPIWEYVLKGCYLEDYDPAGGELGGESEALRPTLTLYYDTFTDRKL